jgi:hypothetical protein
MVTIARQCIIWTLCGLVLLALVAGGLSCKEEEGEITEGETVEQETVATETKEPAEEKTGQETPDFEEEEGVEQESPPQYDY